MYITYILLYIHTHIYMYINIYIMHAKSLQFCLTLYTLWTIACQSPLSMGFFRKNIGVGCYPLLQGIFLTQELNPHLLHWKGGSLPLAPPGKPTYTRRYILLILFLWRNLTKLWYKKKLSSMITGNSTSIKHIYLKKKKNIVTIIQLFRILKIMHDYCKNKTKHTKNQKSVKIAHFAYQV